MSPAIKIAGIPAGTAKLEIYFTDEDYGNEGGHGGFEVKISGVSEISIPSMEGQADDKLPKNVKGIQKHHDDRSDGKYYLGPYSGNRYHQISSGI